MVHTVKPKLGQTVYDPCCGTGGFLAIAYEHIARNLGSSPLSTDIEALKHDTFFGREKENLVLPIALANLVLHGIDQPNLWHGNSLTRRTTHAALFDKAPKQFDVILTNPPFGGKEGKDAQKNFSFETSSTQVLFVQDILAELAPKGTCAIVLDEGMLFRTNESSFVETKRKLVDECDLWATLSLPGGVFSTAGAGVKTNLLFFTKGKKTERIWYYDLSSVKVGKKTPLTLAHFGFGTDGSVLPDGTLPMTLTAEWQDNEANVGKPYPSYASMLAHFGAASGNSPVSWTVDFTARRAKASEEMTSLIERGDADQRRSRQPQGRPQTPEKVQGVGRQHQRAEHQDQREGEGLPRFRDAGRKHRRGSVRSEGGQSERGGSSRQSYARADHRKHQRTGPYCERRVGQAVSFGR
jgi:type I restriction enzyme M protein